MPNTEMLRGNFHLFNFEIIDEDVQNDLCLIKTRRNPFTEERKSFIKTKEEEFSYLVGIADINPNRPVDGVSIGISGYPFQYNVLITNSGVVASSWYIDVIEPENTEDLWSPTSYFDRYVGDIEVNRGNSGGPVYLVSDALVIGVCVSKEGANVWKAYGKPAIILGKQLFYNSGLTTIIPSKYIIALLEKNDITWGIE